MSEPQLIEFDKIQVGDTIRIVRMFPSGTNVVTEGKIKKHSYYGVVLDAGLPTGDDLTHWWAPKDGPTEDFAFLLHRPPIRRRITFDELRDWKAVPIGTRIEFETEPFGKAIVGKLNVRRETSESGEGWEVEVSGCWVQLSSIKEDTLFVIEESKP